MKNILLLTITIIFASSVVAQENPWNKKLPFENATINYKVTGTLNGKKTIYIKEYGKISAEYTETSMKMFGMVQQQKEAIITTPDWEYTIDLSSGTGTKQANPTKYLTDEFNKLSSSQQKTVINNAEKLGVSTIEDLDGEIEKNVVEILGYKCDKASIMGTTVFLISDTDTALKIEGNTMGINYSETATSIEKGEPAAAKFKLPPNIQFSHIKEDDQAMQNHAKTVIKNLLAGKKTAIATTSPNEDNGQSEQLSPEQQQQLQQMMKMMGGQKNN